MKSAVLSALVLPLALSACSEPIGPALNIFSGECLTCDSAELNARCADAEDNDEDRLTDCEDPDCAEHPTCNIVLGPENVAELCADGADNDGNGFIDCNDFGCTPTAACRPEVPEAENTDARCFDGLDNDHDGRIDCRDSDCLNVNVTVCEGSDAACSDGIDNDENGFTDCNDFSCSQNDNVTVCK